MQDKSLAVNVFDEGNSSPQQTPEQQQTTQSNQNETNSQLKTSDEQAFDKQPTDTHSGLGLNNRSDDGVMAYVPWIGAGIVAIVILIALFTILRKLSKK